VAGVVAEGKDEDEEIIISNPKEPHPTYWILYY
jgi:hypothetical protein